MQNEETLSAEEGCLGTITLIVIGLAIAIVLRGGTSTGETAQLCGGLFVAFISLTITIRTEFNYFALMVFIIIGLPLLAWTVDYVVTGDFEGFSVNVNEEQDESAAVEEAATAEARYGNGVSQTSAEGTEAVVPSGETQANSNISAEGSIPSDENALIVENPTEAPIEGLPAISEVETEEAPSESIAGDLIGSTLLATDQEDNSGNSEGEGEDEEGSRDEILSSPFDPFIDFLGSIGLSREKSKLVTDRFIDLRLIFGIILIVQQILVLYVNKRSGLVPYPIVNIIMLPLTFLIIFTKITEWLYELALYLMDQGTIGEIGLVVLSALAGIAGQGNISAYIAANVYYDENLMLYVVLPSIVLSIPILLVRIARIPPSPPTPPSPAQETAQWFNIALSSLMTMGLVYLALQGATLDDNPQSDDSNNSPVVVASATEAPTELAPDLEAAESPTESPIETIETVPPPEDDIQAEATEVDVGDGEINFPGMLAFTIEDEGRQYIIILNGKTGEARRLFDNDANHSQPAWSPDGTWLAFFSTHESAGDIYVMALDESNPTNLTRNQSGTDFQPTWSSDGNNIVFVSSRTDAQDIWWMDNQGGGQQPLSFDDPIDSDPVMSPDGSQILFVSERDGEGDIYSFSMETFEIERITINPRNRDYNPVWSPDGSQILFVSERSPLGNRQLYLANADGTNEILVSAHRADVYAPAWSHDGRQIAYVEYTGTRYQIAIAPLMDYENASVVYSAGFPIIDLAWHTDSESR